MGSGGTSGMVTDDLEIFRLSNSESEVVGGACGVADRKGVSKNGSNKWFIYGYSFGLCERSISNIDIFVNCNWVVTRWQ